MYDMYDLENNSYISYSGGKDSTVVSFLFDLAIPSNKIPRLFLNTGIEYREMLKFVKAQAKEDARILIHNVGVNIRDMLNTYGYPFKSKEHALKVSVYQHSGLGKTVLNYIGKGDKKTFLCPEILKYQFTPQFTLKVSNKCCYKLKKEPAEKWAKENGKTIDITGMRQSEGGLRLSHSSCAVFSKGKLQKFHPLFPVPDSFVEYVVRKYDISLCKLYQSPYNFKRTGCKGCPFSVDLAKQLDKLEALLPTEKKQCEIIWKPVYEEYRKIGYRLKD